MLDELYKQKCSEVSDINEHLPTLKKLAEDCDTILELGVRNAVSTIGFLAGRPKELTSVDINTSSLYFEHVTHADGTKTKFIEANDLDIEPFKVDMIFIDTDHTYEQLSKELKKFGGYAQKYIVMHDTEVYKGQVKAIDEFMSKKWSRKVYTNNSGLTVLTNENRNRNT